jgi:hypothetical protein
MEIASMHPLVADRGNIPGDPSNGRDGSIYCITTDVFGVPGSPWDDRSVDGQSCDSDDKNGTGGKTHVDL